MSRIRRSHRHADFDGRRAGAARTAPASRSTSPLLVLQSTAGNRAVVALVRSRTAQRQPSGEAKPAPPPPGPKPLSAAQPAGVAEHLLTDAEKADLPATADAPALLAENKALYAAREARRGEAAAKAKRNERVDPATKEFTPEEQARVDELNRQLKARMKGDEEETLKANGITTGAAAWFAEVKSYSFLGHAVIVHRLLAERLAKAESALAKETPPDKGWFSGTSSLRPVREGLHSYGLAIDLDGGKNPYLVNPDAPGATSVEATATSRAISDIINRAGLLVRAKTASEVDLQSRPTNADRDARALESYDKLLAASNALRQYMELDAPAQRPALEAFVTALAGKDERTADQWAEQIAKDRKALRAKASGKSWQEPEKGFLTLDKRLVKAMTASADGGLTWLGDDTIGSGRDIMHFDMRGLGPIRKIVKSLEGTTMGLGSG